MEYFFLLLKTHFLSKQNTVIFDSIRELKLLKKNSFDNFQSQNYDKAAKHCINLNYNIKLK